MSGALLLDDVVRFVRRFVVLSATQAVAIALWVAHTHAIDAADTTPYHAVTSAEKRSGKSRLLEVLELLVASPLPTSSISDAALYRAIDKLTPTLLLDEADGIFGKKRNGHEREDLRRLLNAGWRRGAVARRMGGPRMTTLEEFPVFCAKAFAGIGDYLPDTLSDRAIWIRLERRTRDEPVERFRRREVVPEGEMLRDRLTTGWSRSSTNSAPPGRRSQRNSTTAPGTSGSRCLRSPTWPAATGPSGRGGPRSRSPAGKRVRTTRSAPSSSPTSTRSSPRTAPSGSRPRT